MTANKKTIINAPIAPESEDDVYEVTEAKYIKGTFPIGFGTDYADQKPYRGQPGTVIYNPSNSGGHPEMSPQLGFFPINAPFSWYTLLFFPSAGYINGEFNDFNRNYPVWNSSKLKWEPKRISSRSTLLTSGMTISVTDIERRVFYYAGAENNDIPVPANTSIGLLIDEEPVNDMVITLVFPKLSALGALNIASSLYPLHLLNGAYSTTLRNVVMIHFVKFETNYHLHMVIRNY